MVGDRWRQQVTQTTTMKQGYLNSTPERTVRVRIAGDRAMLTIKGKSQSLSRKEFEYEIPLSEAQDLIELCEQPIIEKTRHLYPYQGHTWEIDEFGGENTGLLVAEIELSREDEAFAKPDWLGQEVSADQRYFNSALISNPYSQWKAE